MKSQPQNPEFRNDQEDQGITNLAYILINWFKIKPLDLLIQLHPYQLFRYATANAHL